MLHVRMEHYVIRHSDKGYTEASSEVVGDAEVEIGQHKYS